MWIDQHPYVFIYLLGCALVVILSMFKMLLFWLIAWITKGNIFVKNVKKLDPVDEQGFGQKIAVFIGILTFEAALSWINVLVVICQIAVNLLKILREALASTPEAIKLLRFPLSNNPNMSREAVWAYVQALEIKIGEKIPNEAALLSSLSNVRETHPSFDREAALYQLNGLNVMSGDVISSAKQHLAAA
jgi:hypothetical protein